MVSRAISQPCSRATALARARSVTASRRSRPSSRVQSRSALFPRRKEHGGGSHIGAPFAFSAPVALSRRCSQNLESIREPAGTFVDIVKFAMRGLRARSVASFGEGNPLGASHAQCSAVLCVIGARRLIVVAALASAALAAGAAAFAAAAYGLLGREAPDFGLHAVAGSNVRLSEYRGEVV